MGITTEKFQRASLMVQADLREWLSRRSGWTAAQVRDLAKMSLVSRGAEFEDVTVAVRWDDPKSECVVTFAGIHHIAMWP